jgi:hypothetical protein
MATGHATAQADPAQAPGAAPIVLEPCLSPAERAMVKVLTALLRRHPAMARKRDGLLHVARSGLAAAEPDPALAERRARRVVLLILSRTAATRRAAAGT